MNKSDQVKNIIGAMIIFREKLIQPKATGFNHGTGQPYLTLSDIQGAIDKACEGTGLLPTMETRTDDTTVYVKTVVYHETGEFMEFDEIAFPIMVKDMQAFGSAITYTQKYSLKSAFGIAAAEEESENDGEGNKGVQQTFANKTQKELIFKKIEEQAESTESSFNDVWNEIAAELNISSKLEAITEDDAGTVLNRFVKQSEKLKKQQAKNEKFPWEEEKNNDN